MNNSTLVLIDGRALIEEMRRLVLDLNTPAYEPYGNTSAERRARSARSHLLSCLERTVSRMESYHPHYDIHDLHDILEAQNDTGAR